MITLGVPYCGVGSYKHGCVFDISSLPEVKLVKHWKFPSEAEGFWETRYWLGDEIQKLMPKGDKEEEEEDDDDDENAAYPPLWERHIFGKLFQANWTKKRSSYCVYSLHDGEEEPTEWEGPHVNHCSPFAYDSEYMLIADNSGEDACYSLRIIKWRTYDEVKKINFSQNPHYIEAEWPRGYFCGLSTLYYLQLENEEGNMTAFLHGLGPEE